MKKCFLLFLSFLFLFNLLAQEQQVLRLSSEQIETLFLKQNLQLVAEQLNISIADANIAQAKLWDNPEFSISSVNLWTTDSQREGEKEVIPPVLGSSFARNTQFSIELSQLIQTANKRGKLVRKEKVSKEIALQEFEEVLRGMKIELRKSINELYYLQSYKKTLSNQETYIDELITAYRRQEAKGNIAKSELLRLQSASLELENEQNEVQTDLNEQQKNLKSLLNVPPHILIEVEAESNSSTNPATLSLANLLDIATASRPDIKRQKLETELHAKSLAYEKAMRIPDLTISANYDRRGGVWNDFIGFGVSFDLPFLNRNQGNIKVARFSQDQSQYLEQQQQNIAQHEVAEAFYNYTQAYKFNQKISENTLLAELDGMLEIYTKNLLNKNISMLEYIDFMDSYKTNKQTILSSHKNLNILFEELQYTIGSELK